MKDVSLPQNRGFHPIPPRPSLWWSCAFRQKIFSSFLIMAVSQGLLCESARPQRIPFFLCQQPRSRSTVWNSPLYSAWVFRSREEPPQPQNSTCSEDSHLQLEFPPFATARAWTKLTLDSFLDFTWHGLIESTVFPLSLSFPSLRKFTPFCTSPFKLARVQSRKPSYKGPSKCPS